MKSARLLLVALVVAVLASCSKTNDLGVVIRPGSDDMRVTSDSFIVVSSTVSRRDFYSETDKPLLGNYIDEVFGSFSIDFVSEFRYVRGVTYPSNAVLDSLDLVLYYKSFFGDSSRVHELAAYRVDLKGFDFNENYTADTDISEFCSKTELLGKKSYTAYDQTISDSLREAGYCNVVRVRMPAEMGNEILTKPELSESQANFSEWLHGIYVTTTYGLQTVVYVDSVNLELAYHYAPEPETKPDSIVDRYVMYPSNKEVTSFVMANVVEEPNMAYYADTVDIMSTPIGFFPKITIPFDRIYERVCNGRYHDKMNINHASMVIEKALFNDYDGRMSPANYYVLVREDDIDYFFTQSLYPAPDANTALAMFVDSTYYLSANIGDYIEEILTNKEYVDKNFEGLNDYLVVPISGTTNISGSNAVVRPSFAPTGIRLCSSRNERSPMRLIITYTDL